MTFPIRVEDLKFLWQLGPRPANHSGLREKQQSGFIARAFSTHPMNDDRIRRAEAELEMLPDRNDYVLTTSEFEQVKSRLIRLTRGRTVDDGKAMPTLRKHTVEDDGPPILKKTPGALQ